MCMVLLCMVIIIICEFGVCSRMLLSVFRLVWLGRDRFIRIMFGECCMVICRVCFVLLVLVIIFMLVKFCSRWLRLVWIRV